MDIWMKRGLRGLEPYDDSAVDALRRLKIGTIVRAEITKPRNIHFHRKFFAMLNLVWQSSGDWHSAEELLDALKYRMGYCESRELVAKDTGEVFRYVRLKSISFAAMDDLQFESFYEQALHVLCELAGGIEPRILQQEVLQQLAAA
jgi:hypothetical protein